MRRTYFKQRKKNNYVTFLLIVLIIIFALSIRFFFIVSEGISSKLLQVADMSIFKFTNHIVADFSAFQDFSDEELNSIFKIQKNDKNEILAVDYNMKQTYTIAQALTNKLKEEIKNLEMGKTNIDYYDKMISSEDNSFILMLPLGLASHHTYINNLGPKIPVKVSFIESIFTNINTRVTNYGLNNALLEVYLEVEIQYEMIIPNSTERNKIRFDTLIAAKVINGRVPEYFGGILNSQSNVATSSFK